MSDRRTKAVILAENKEIRAGAQAVLTAFAQLDGRIYNDLRTKYGVPYIDTDFDVLLNTLRTALSESEGLGLDTADAGGSSEYEPTSESKEKG